MKSVNLAKTFVSTWTRQDIEDYNSQIVGIPYETSQADDQELATFEFEAELKTEHDLKGKFSIGFMLIDKKDGMGPKLAVFDDDRKIIGTFDDNEHAIRILDKMIETKKARHLFSYTAPNKIKTWREDKIAITGHKAVKILDYNEETIRGFELSKKILQEGSIPQESLSKWRMEN